MKYAIKQLQKTFFLKQFSQKYIKQATKFAMFLGLGTALLTLTACCDIPLIPLI